jgi:hypothetical protein
VNDFSATLNGAQSSTQPQAVPAVPVGAGTPTSWFADARGNAWVNEFTGTIRWPEVLEKPQRSVAPGGQGSTPLTPSSTGEGVQVVTAAGVFGEPAANTNINTTVVGEAPQAPTKVESVPARPAPDFGPHSIDCSAAGGSSIIHVAAGMNFGSTQGSASAQVQATPQRPAPAPPAISGRPLPAPAPKAPSSLTPEQLTDLVLVLAMGQSPGTNKAAQPSNIPEMLLAVPAEKETPLWVKDHVFLGLAQTTAAKQRAKDPGQGAKNDASPSPEPMPTKDGSL